MKGAQKSNGGQDLRAGGQCRSEGHFLIFRVNKVQRAEDSFERAVFKNTTVTKSL